MEGNREWNTAWKGSQEQMHGTDLERKYFVLTAASNGSLEQMHGTDLERKYFVWNSCMEQKSILCLEQLHGMEVWNSCIEQKSGTDAWNRSGTEILCLEQLHGTEVRNRCMELT